MLVAWLVAVVVVEGRVADVATLVVVGVSAVRAVVGDGDARHAPTRPATTTAIAQSALVFTLKFLAREDRGWRRLG